MALKDIRLFGTTSAGGAATLIAERPVFGRLVAVEWIDGSFDDGVDGTLSVIRTPSGVDLTLLTLTDANNDALYYPRHQVHGSTGAGLTLDGTRLLVEMPIITGTLQLVIAQGGDAKTGGCIVYYEA